MEKIEYWKVILVSAVFGSMVYRSDKKKQSEISRLKYQADLDNLKIRSFEGALEVTKEELATTIESNRQFEVKASAELIVLEELLEAKNDEVKAVTESLSYEKKRADDSNNAYQEEYKSHQDSCRSLKSTRDLLSATEEELEATKNLLSATEEALKAMEDLNKLIEAEVGFLNQEMSELKTH